MRNNFLLCPWNNPFVAAQSDKTWQNNVVNFLHPPKQVEKKKKKKKKLIALSQQR